MARAGCAISRGGDLAIEEIEMRLRSFVGRGALAVLVLSLLLPCAGCGRSSGGDHGGVPPVVIATQSLPDALEGAPYAFALTASGGLSPYTWSVTAGVLPAGITLDSVGNLSGTPTASGGFNFNVEVSDSQPTPATDTASLNLTVIPELTILTTSLPDGTLGTAYAATLTATGGVAPYTWGVAFGSLPPGVSLSPNGDLSGTPMTQGLFSFTAGVTDSQSPPSYRAAALQIAVYTPPATNTPPELSPGLLPGPKRGLVEVVYKLIDMDGDPVTINVQYSTDGGLTYAPATSSALAGEGTGPVQASPVSAIHLYVWDSYTDLGATRASVILSLIPVDSQPGIGGPTTSFDVDNQPGRSICTVGPVLQEPRMDHTTTLLADGTVLVAGGIGTGGSALDSAEIYSPITGTSTLLPTLLSTARARHTATLLPDGRVLLAGGVDSVGMETASAETYDPVTGGFVATSPMADRRARHAAAVGAGGVFVSGGAYDQGPATLYIDRVESFDPTSDTFAAPLGLAEARDSHTATYLPNDRILLVGGSGGDYLTAEEFDPASSTSPVTVQFTAFAEIRVHATTLLPSGTVLVTGGAPGRGVISVNNSFDEAFLYSSSSGFTATGPMLDTRSFHTATLLFNGRVQIAGGIDNFTLMPQADSEVYDLAGQFVRVGPMTVARARQAAVLLQDGRVLITGGTSDLLNPLDTTDHFHP